MELTASTLRMLMSSVFHSNSADQNRMLCRKAADALVPGGQLVVRDFLMNETRSGPLAPALFALNMLVGTPSGDTFTESEVRGFMADAGFRDLERKDTASASVLVGRL